MVVAAVVAGFPKLKGLAAGAAVVAGWAAVVGGKENRGAALAEAAVVAGFDVLAVVGGLKAPVPAPNRGF